MRYYKVFQSDGRFVRWCSERWVAELLADSFEGYYQQVNLGGPEWRPDQETGTDGPDLTEVPVKRSTKKPMQMIVHHARACALLHEALDWIGAVNLTEQEETLAHDFQHRIARLLEEVRM